MSPRTVPHNFPAMQPGAIVGEREYGSKVKETRRGGGEEWGRRGAGEERSDLPCLHSRTPPLLSSPAPPLPTPRLSLLVHRADKKRRPRPVDPLGARPLPGGTRRSVRIWTDPQQGHEGRRCQARVSTLFRFALLLVHRERLVEAFDKDHLALFFGRSALDLSLAALAAEAEELFRHRPDGQAGSRFRGTAGGGRRLPPTRSTSPFGRRVCGEAARWPTPDGAGLDALMDASLCC